MKKLAVILVLSIVCLKANGQYFDVPTLFGLGYSNVNVHDNNTTDNFKTFEMTVPLFFVAFGGGYQRLDANVYGFGVYTSKSYFKAGLCLPRFYFSDKGGLKQNSIGLSIYYSGVSSWTQDSSGNYIGWSENPSLCDYKNSTDYHYSYFGVRIDYTISILNVGINLSQNEISFSIGIAIGCPAYHKLGIIK